MTPREELDLLLELIRKYNLPLSPILEYAVNEKKDEYQEKENAAYVLSETKDKVQIKPQVAHPFMEEKTTMIELTREMIEAARTPNGGFTKNQLAVLGISWPAPSGWIGKVVGTFITPKQLEEFNHIEYASGKPSRLITSYFSQRTETYKDVASGDSDMKHLAIVVNSMEHFDVPVTPRDVARIISCSVWGESVQEESIDSILKRLPEVEYIPWGKYILKSKKK